MAYSYDLHIHSCLSPCGDGDMTPNNIVGMAKLKGLDIIAVCDHNSAMNLSAIAQCAAENDLLLIPGIEVETSEEIHALCYFPSVDQALAFGEMLQSHLPGIPNNVDIFGCQHIMDSNDQIIGEQETLLITATDISIDELPALCREYGGVMVPAHVDKQANSIISNLGFIPEDLPINCIELSKNDTDFAFARAKGLHKQYTLLQSSDAHYLGDIAERTHFVHLAQKNVGAVLDFLQNHRVKNE